MVEKLSEYGLDNQVITLQYESTNREQKRQISGRSSDSERPKSRDKGWAPSLNYKGMVNTSSAFDQLPQADIVHLHCPFMGAGHRVLRFLRDNPQIPTIATYYRPVELTDLISVYVSLYNAYYLPKIFRLCKVVGVFEQTFKKYKFSGLQDKKIIDLNAQDNDDVIVARLTNDEKRVKLNNRLTANLSATKLAYIYSILTGQEV